MDEKVMQKISMPVANDDRVWELFHENSKIGRFDAPLSNDEILAQMQEFHESLPFVGYPIVELPPSLTPLKQAVDETIVARESVRDMVPVQLSLENLATLLHYAYGETRDNKDTEFPRPFKVVPSAGALYPLEIFFYSAHIEGLEAGVYHYNPSKKHLRLLQVGDKIDKISKAMVDPEMARSASLILFITAIFERSVFKYRDRGYRFILLEAGHMAQNLSLVAIALGFGAINIGGYFDREVDDFLGLDGVTHSTIYMLAMGKKKGA